MWWQQIFGATNGEISFISNYQNNNDDCRPYELSAALQTELSSYQFVLAVVGAIFILDFHGKLLEMNELFLRGGTRTNDDTQLIPAANRRPLTGLLSHIACVYYVGQLIYVAEAKYTYACAAKHGRSNVLKYLHWSARISRRIGRWKKW